MDKIRITGDGTPSNTQILDADGKEIKGLNVKRLIITQDASAEEDRPKVTLSLVPGSFDFDMVGELSGIQKDIISEISHKLFLMQDSLHGKSLDTVQNEIYELQRQLEKLTKVNSNHNEIVMKPLEKKPLI